MKFFFPLFLFAVLHITVSGQVATNHLVDQVLISFNRTLEDGYYTENRIGFGLGVYHTFLPQNRLNFNFGIEFNRTSQFEKVKIIGHFASYNDLKYNKNCVTLPLNLRMTIGQKVKCFFEVGGFWDWVIYSKQKGILHTYIPDGNGQPQDRYYNINENAGLVSAFGFSFGIGIRIPGNHYDIIIKPDYKQKFNKWFFEKDRVLSKLLRINLGITLN